MNHLTVGEDPLDYDQQCRYCGEDIHFAKDGFCNIDCKLAYHYD